MTSRQPTCTPQSRCANSLCLASARLFAALTMIPLADVTAITFTAPLFLTVLAMLFLGERIHYFRWTALGVGFLGVLIMVGPHLSFGLYQPVLRI
jgi:drug/metabolite transporter (DMT)-like permease